MSSPKKPEYMAPYTQTQALESFKPQGFYAPYGSIRYGDSGYATDISDTYLDEGATTQYNQLRSKLLSDILGTTDTSAYDEYGKAFMDKSLEYSLPRLTATSYGRGQAGSRTQADATADLINKASTDAVLNRAQLKNIDDTLRLNQLNTVESGLTNQTNRIATLINQLLQGSQVSEAAKSSSLNQGRQYVEDKNTLEAERYNRAMATPNWFDQTIDYGNKAAELALKVAALSNPATAPLAMLEFDPNTFTNTGMQTMNIGGVNRTFPTVAPPKLAFN